MGPPTMVIGGPITPLNYRVIPSLKLLTSNIAPEKCGAPGKGDSYWKPPFLGSKLLGFMGV